MNSRPLATRFSGHLALAASLVLALGTLCPQHAAAQDPAASPSPSPTPTPDPAATPTPTPAPPPDDTPSFTITPGVPDASVQADYTAARTPQASIVLSAQASSASHANAAVGKALGAGRALSAASVASTLQPVVANGVATIVSLLPAATPATRTPLASKTAVSSAAATSTPAVPLAVVTLNYGEAYAGEAVLVRPLGGGTVSATGGDGNLYSAASGLLLTVDSTGALTFGFQAPAAAQTYQVYTRLDNVVTTFSFLVPDGNE